MASWHTIAVRLLFFALMEAASIGELILVSISGDAQARRAIIAAARHGSTCWNALMEDNS